MGEIKLIKADTCSPEDPINEIAKKMYKDKKRRFFVIDNKENLIGIITTVDIVKLVSENMDSKKTKVKDIMTKKVKSIDFEKSIEEALEIMNELKTFVCPVTKGGKLLGIVSYQDILSGVVTEARSK